jgi:hypothetical protein
MMYTVKFDQAGLALLGEALGALPHKQVAGLIGNIQMQINQQEAAAKQEAAQKAVADAPKAAVARAADAVVADAIAPVALKGDLKPKPPRAARRAAGKKP